jgi:hypothetical protein
LGQYQTQPFDSSDNNLAVQLPRYFFALSAGVKNGTSIAGRGFGAGFPDRFAAEFG